MKKDKLVKALHWFGFLWSLYLIIYLAVDAFSFLEKWLPFLFAAVPFIIVVFIRYKLTGKKTIFPWMND